MLRYLQLLLALIQFGFMAYTIYDENGPNQWGVVLLLGVVGMGLPVLVVLNFLRTNNPDSLVALYFKRKALEERKKIQALGG